MLLSPALSIFISPSQESSPHLMQTFLSSLPFQLPRLPLRCRQTRLRRVLSFGYRWPINRWPKRPPFCWLIAALSINLSLNQTELNYSCLPSPLTVPTGHFCVGKYLAAGWAACLAELLEPNSFNYACLRLSLCLCFSSASSHFELDAAAGEQREQ